MTSQPKRRGIRPGVTAYVLGTLIFFTFLVWQPIFTGIVINVTACLYISAVVDRRIRQRQEGEAET